MATPAHKEREVELFSLLKSANLLDYYNNFIAQGGDDIQQLCEASEDEFKEIVSLVGMSTKPLHVRRLQKALVEWRSQKASTKGTPKKATSWIQKWTPSPQPSRSALFAVGTSSGRKRPHSSAAKSGSPATEKRMVELKLPPMDVIIDWEKLDPERQRLIREHSRIYGRDEKKRKTSDLNSHEQMINEAAAQLCLRDPTLLVRRDELFTLARRVVRDSGFTYVHGHSRSKFAADDEENVIDEEAARKSSISQANKLKREERLSELEQVIQNAKANVQQILLKLDEAKSLNAASEVNDLQAELSKQQTQVVSLQMEQKELKKKQRRSERYYSNKATKDVEAHKDSISNEGDDIEPEEDGDDEEISEAAQGVSAEEEVASGESAQQEVVEQPSPSVVTEILPQTSDPSPTVPQRTEQGSEEENSVRALYSAFIPAHLQGEDVHQVQPVQQIQHADGTQGYVHYQALRPQQLHAFAGGAISTDPTINALLSLSAKDKTVIQGVPVTSAQGMTVAAMPVSTGGVPIFTSPNIAVVMPGQPLPNNMQWS